MIIFYSFANYLCWGQIFVSCISCDNFGEISNFKFTMAAVNGTTCSASVLNIWKWDRFCSNKLHQSVKTSQDLLKQNWFVANYNYEKITSFQ